MSAGLEALGGADRLPEDAEAPAGFGAGIELFFDRHATAEQIEALGGPAPVVSVEGLVAGYGRREVLHGVDLRVGGGQSVCLIGPNGAGKSTLLHSLCGLTDVRAGRVSIGGLDVMRLSPSARLRDGRIAYVMQDASVFPDMTVEQNLCLGGYLLGSRAKARAAAEAILDRYPLLAARRGSPARVLSGGERRLLELGRALIMRPRLLLIDEPSIGLAGRFVDLVFEILDELQHREGIAILMVEQNAAKGLAFADVGYVMVAGQVAMVGAGADLLRDPAVGRLFLGR
jgi:branched-chain amino acid transport system ATP-binding protein